MATHKKAAVRVRSVRGLLRKPEAWCKYTYAKNANGIGISAEANDAVRFCLSGAITRVYGSRFEQSGKVYDRLLSYLKRSYKARSIVSFNDRRKTTHADILKVCRAVKI
jgi:hypothetical protein